MQHIAEVINNDKLVQFLVVTSLTVTICVLVLFEKSVPSEVKDPYLLVLGFYFGTKIQSGIESNRRAVMEGNHE